ncbi:GA module-containing protein [Carnobacteriaceae bacterium zg-84]|nr:GA module-containing protein [Carnobacteriaceae bacterium zg-84]
MFNKKKDRFSIRKFKTGVGSIFLGSFLLITPQVFAHGVENTELTTEATNASVVEKPKTTTAEEKTASETEKQTKEKAKNITFEDFKKMTTEEIKALTVEDFEQLNLTDEIVESLSLEQQKALTLSKNFQNYKSKQKKNIEGNKFRDGGVISDTEYGWNSREGNDSNIVKDSIDVKVEWLGDNGSGQNRVRVTANINKKHDWWKEPLFYVTVPEGLTVTSVSMAENTSSYFYSDGNVLNDWATSIHRLSREKGKRSYVEKTVSYGYKNDGFEGRWRDTIGWHMEKSWNTTPSEIDRINSIKNRTKGILSFETEETTLDYRITYTATVDSSIKSADEVALIAGFKSNQLPIGSAQNYARAYLKVYKEATPVQPAPTPSPSSNPASVTFSSSPTESTELIMWAGVRTDKDVKLIDVEAGDPPVIYLADDSSDHPGIEAKFTGNLAPTKPIFHYDKAKKEFYLKAGSIFGHGNSATPGGFNKRIVANTSKDRIDNPLARSGKIRFMYFHIPEDVTIDKNSKLIAKSDLQEELLKLVKYEAAYKEQADATTFIINRMRNGSGKEVDKITDLNGLGNTLEVTAVTKDGFEKNITVTLNILDKEATKKSIDELKKEIDDSNNRRDDLTEEEKQAAAEATRLAAEDAKNKIDGANDISNLKRIKAEADKKIYEKHRVAAKDKPNAIEEIDQEKRKQDEEINNSSLSESEKQAAKDKIAKEAEKAKEAINNSPTRDKVNEAKNAGIEAMKLPKAKQAAVTALAQAQNEANAAIAANDNLSPEEKAKAKKEVDDATSAAIDAINKATNSEGITAGQTEGLGKIELAKAKAEAVGNLEKAKADAKAAIEQNGHLSSEQKDKAKGEVDAATTEAIEAVGNATDKEGVTAAETSATPKVDLAKAKAEAIEALAARVESANSEIDNAQGLDNSQKKH